MAGPGLFATPAQIRQAQMAMGQQQDLLRASMPAGRGTVALGSHLGRLAGNIPRLFGASTQNEKVATARQAALSKAQSTAGDDPASFLRAAASNLMKIGDFQGAFEVTGKLQSLMAAQAQAAKDATAANLNLAKTGNEINRFGHETDLKSQDIQGQKEIQNMKAAQSTREINAKLQMEGIKLTHDDANKFQDRLIKMQDLQIQADRAGTYAESVEARTDYWQERLGIMRDKLLAEKENNKSLNASRQFKSLMGQATEDYKKATTEKMATEILGISPEVASKVKQTTLFNRLPASAREKLSKDFSDFIGKLNPMDRFLKKSLEGELPSQSEINQFAPGSNEPDLFLDLTQER